ncbi:MAG: YqgE/AlgH family protein [Planctomycetes bacterium]|nr:YqgE/AlgH family protein [Planctomycetota bacterium]HPF15311.1 YqgE/AlgH family protein [Planctomycetota bacterium]
MSQDSIPMAPLKAGALLVASPQLQDPNFMHSVVLLCSYGAEGAMGFALNEASGFEAGDLLSGHEELEACRQPVFLGGPVGRDQLHFLHRLPGRIGGGLEVFPGLWLGGAYGDLTEALQDPHGEDEPLRLYVGYSGWGRDQLDREIAEGSWLVLGGSKELPFECHGQSREEVWRRVLRAQGPGGRYLAQQPPDPTWN